MIKITLVVVLSYFVILVKAHDVSLNANGQEITVVNTTIDLLNKVFGTGKDVNLDGFHEKAECGGTYKASTTEQYIYSPRYVYYRRRKACHYNITGLGERVQLKFLEFDLLDGETLSINSDHLYEKTYGGNKIPNIEYADPEFNLVFNPDNSVEGKGFRLVYSIYACGGHVKEPTTLTSGLLDRYQGDLNCTWLIEAPENKTVVLEFIYFHLEVNYKCESDYLAIYEGSNADVDNRLALLCGQVKHNPVIRSKGNTMTIKFVTDPYIGYEGFKIKILFTYSESVGCGGNIDVTSSHTLTSPRISSELTYDNFLDCHWNIKAPIDHVIKVQFTSFHIAPCRHVNQTAVGLSRCDCDSLQVRDGIDVGSLLFNTYCGHSLPPDIVSSGNTLSIRLATDGELTSSGFIANVIVQESLCGISSFNASQVAQRIKSPGYDNGSVPRSIHCSYYFQTYTPYQLTHIHFNDLDLEPATTNKVCDKDKVIISSGNHAGWSLGKDYIKWGHIPTLSSAYIKYMNYKLFNADSPEQYDICESKKPVDVYVTGSFSINVMTAPDATTQQFKGVDLEVVLVGACSRNYTGLYSRVKTTIDVLRDESVTDCYTLISVPENYTISVYFSKIDNYVAPSDVFLDIYDGANTTSTKLFNLTGSYQSVTKSIFSSSNNILMHNHFVNEVYYIYYDLTYMATDKGQGCGGYFYGEDGLFTSPLYPGAYRESTTCEWRLETYHGTKVALHFETFDLGRDCDHNYLQLVDRSGTELARYCSETPANFVSADNYVSIVFVTNSSNEGEGWLIRFKGIF